MLAAMAPVPDPTASDGLVRWKPDPARGPVPDPAAEPQGFIVAGDEVRVHFLDWSDAADLDAGDGEDLQAGSPGVLLVPGLLQSAWTWAPVARRLGGTRRTAVEDLRGQGLSDSPADGYDLESLAADAITVAEAAGLLPGGEGPIIVAGHGFGGIVAAAAAARLGQRCAGLVLVDGGWERLETTTGLDVDEFLRGLDEPPEVMRSMDAWLADRRGFDPPSWDADQERAAREAVVETAAGRVVRTARPFVVEALVRTMCAYEPAETLGTVEAPVTALIALGGGDGLVRLEELRRAAGSRPGPGGIAPIRFATFPGDAHNLMRYRPAEVAAAILGSTG